MNWTTQRSAGLSVVVSSQAAAGPASRSCDRVASRLSALNVAPTRSANYPSARDPSRG
jgi:hypothetical protein